MGRTRCVRAAVGGGGLWLVVCPKSEGYKHISGEEIAACPIHTISLECKTCACYAVNLCANLD